MTEEKPLDGTVYLIFLKGNTYVGITTKTLDERMKEHKKAQTIKPPEGVTINFAE